MTDNSFDILILIGRPASGKSEIIHFLTHLSDEERWASFHMGSLDVLDDFPILWGWFEEDDILGNVFGLPRLHSDEQGYFKQQAYWHSLIRQLSLGYAKKVRDDAAYHDHTTALIEFSRGSEHGGYTAAMQHLSDEILERTVVMYVSVPFEESLRKNRRRFNPNKPDSILEHGLSDEKMERLYRDDDWSILAPDDSGYLNLGGYRVPYVTFHNEDDVTTGKPDELASRLKSVLKALWTLYQEKS